MMWGHGIASKIGGPWNHQPISSKDTSKKITSPLTALIMEQLHQYPNTIKVEHFRINRYQRRLRTHTSSCGTKGQTTMSLSTEKRNSSWLSALQITEQCFALYMSAFRDVLCLAYGWHPSNLPLQCTCGKRLTCAKLLSWWFCIYPSQWTPWYHCRANERSLPQCWHTTANHWSIVRQTENIVPGSLLQQTASRIMIDSAHFFFFDIRVFNPLAPSYQNTPLAQCYWINE